jgi:hypothetical protein
MVARSERVISEQNGSHRPICTLLGHSFLLWQFSIDLLEITIKTFLNLFAKLIPYSFFHEKDEREYPETEWLAPKPLLTLCTLGPS